MENKKNLKKLLTLLTIHGIIVVSDETTEKIRGVKMLKLEQIQKEIQDILRQMHLTLDNDLWYELLQQYHKLKKLESEYL